MNFRRRRKEGKPSPGVSPKLSIGWQIKQKHFFSKSCVPHHLRPQHMVSHPKIAGRKKNIVKFLLTGIKSIVYNDKCAISSLLGALRLNYVRYGRVSVPGLLSKITIRRCNSWQPNVPISPKSFMVRKYTASARECPPRMVGKSLPAAAPRVALDCLTD